MVSLQKDYADLPVVDSYVHVETPENVWLSFRPAGPSPRLWAYLIDLAIRLGILIALVIVVMFLAPLNAVAGLPGFVFLIGYFALDYLYAFLFEWLWRGRTPGKRVMKLKVIKLGGYPIGFFDAFLRNLLRIVDSLPVGYGLGLVFALNTKRMQRIGDLVAGTFVVHEEREVVRGYPPWIYGVPVIPTGQRSSAYKPTDRVLDLIETFLTRAQRLSRERADEIAHILAPPLARRMQYEEDPPGEIQQSPGWFLLRVLRTFVYPPTAEELAQLQAQGVPTAPLPPGTTPPAGRPPPLVMPTPPQGASDQGLSQAPPAQAPPPQVPPSQAPPNPAPTVEGPPYRVPPGPGWDPPAGSGSGSGSGSGEQP